MTYVHVDLTPGAGYDGHQPIGAALGGAAMDAHLPDVVGVADRALQILGIWSSTAVADPIAEERRFAALGSAGVHSGPGASYTTFDFDMAERAGGDR